MRLGHLAHLHVKAARPLHHQEATVDNLPVIRMPSARWSRKQWVSHRIQETGMGLDMEEMIGAGESIRGAFNMERSAMKMVHSPLQSATGLGAGGESFVLGGSKEHC